MSDQLLDDLVRAYLGEKIKRVNIINQNGANLAYLHGKDIGRKLGLSENDLQGITPFPASTKIVIEKGNNESDETSGENKKSLTRRILPWVLSGALGLGVGSGGILALRPDKEEQKTPVVEQIDPSVGFTIKGQKDE